MICPRCNLETALDGSCDCPEQDRVPLPRTTFRRVNVRTEVLDMQHALSGYHVDEHGRLAVALMITGDGNPCRVDHCQRRASDGYVCAQCVEDWETCLGDVASLVEDLQIAARKQVRFGTREGNAATTTGKKYDPTDSESVQPRHMHTRHPNHTEIPTPVDLRAADRLAELGNELVGQVRLICETNSIEVPALGSDVVAMSRWLLGQAGRLPYLPEQDGAGMVQDLTKVYLAGVAAIDAPARRKYVTGCSCGLAVFVHGEADKVECACGITYDVAEQHAARIDKARDHLVTIDEAATLSGAKRGTIRQWINRGRIEAQGKRWVEILRGEDVFVRREVAIVRYGDVADLLAAKEQSA
jgi:hypothetical protein